MCVCVKGLCSARRTLGFRLWGKKSLYRSEDLQIESLPKNCPNTRRPTKMLLRLRGRNEEETTGWSETLSLACYIVWQGRRTHCDASTEKNWINPTATWGNADILTLLRWMGNTKTPPLPILSLKNAKKISKTPPLPILSLKNAKKISP